MAKFALFVNSYCLKQYVKEALMFYNELAECTCHWWSKITRIFLGLRHGWALVHIPGHWCNTSGHQALVPGGRVHY